MSGSCFEESRVHPIDSLCIRFLKFQVPIDTSVVSFPSFYAQNPIGKSPVCVPYVHPLGCVGNPVLAPKRGAPAENGFDSKFVVRNPPYAMSVVLKRKVSVYLCCDKKAMAARASPRAQHKNGGRPICTVASIVLGRKWAIQKGASESAQNFRRWGVFVLALLVVVCWYVRGGFIHKIVVYWARARSGREQGGEQAEKFCVGSGGSIRLDARYVPRYRAKSVHSIQIGRSDRNSRLLSVGHEDSQIGCEKTGSALPEGRLGVQNGF